jgi:hypothetical protein
MPVGLLCISQPLQSVLDGSWHWHWQALASAAHLLRAGLLVVAIAVVAAVAVLAVGAAFVVVGPVVRADEAVAALGQRAGVAQAFAAAAAHRLVARHGMLWQRPLRLLVLASVLRAAAAATRLEGSQLGVGVGRPCSEHRGEGPCGIRAHECPRLRVQSVERQANLHW